MVRVRVVLQATLRDQRERSHIARTQGATHLRMTPTRVQT